MAMELDLLHQYAGGLYPVLAGPLIKKIFSITCYCMVCISGCDSAIIVKWSTCVCHAISHYSRNDTICFYYILFFFVTVFGLVMWYVGVQKIGASHTMVYMYITPLVAVLFAAVWANEYVSFQQIIGGIIIFVGLWFVKSEKVKSSFYCRGTYIKIGKQITYDLLSYFFYFW